MDNETLERLYARGRAGVLDLEDALAAAAGYARDADDTDAMEAAREGLKLTRALHERLNALASRKKIGGGK